MSVYERYPHLATLRGKVPDDLVEREVNEKAPRFEKYSALAAKAIPSVRLSQVFPPDLEEGRIVLERFLGQWGNITVEEVCKICLIAAWLKPKCIFEIGTFNGMTTLQMAMNTPKECSIITLDVDPKGLDAAKLDIGDVDSHLARKMGAFDVPVGAYFKDSAYSSRIKQVLNDSAKMDFSPWHGKADLVFIDAGHTYEYVKSDTQNALKMLAPGGVILWHDYMQLLHPDVTQYLYELTSDGIAVKHLRGTHLAMYKDARK